jgi:DnaJ family protein C protein 28
MKKIIDEQIRKAMEEGQFDNLPGQGKPLDLDENPLEDPAWRMANHLLKSNGFSPPWLENRKEIETALETARQELRQAHTWRLTAQVLKKPAAAVEAEWERARSAFLRRLEELNKKIFSYNLQAPSLQFQILALNPEREIEKILAGE